MGKLDELNRHDRTTETDGRANNSPGDPVEIRMPGSSLRGGEFRPGCDEHSVRARIPLRGAFLVCPNGAVASGMVELQTHQ